ncbi:MAG: hypothetical protein ACLGI5_04515 [Thermoleophilia bacterium]
MTLGYLADDSIAVSVYVLVRQGAQQRPELAAALRCGIRMHFADGYAPVRIDFRGDEIEVADTVGNDRACELEVSGRLRRMPRARSQNSNAMAPAGRDAVARG